jgi:Tol biopolymer transport system component
MIAFERAGSIMVSAADGGGVRTLVDCAPERCSKGRPPAWAPDGKRLAFAFGVLGGDAVELWVIPTDPGTISADDPRDRAVRKDFLAISSISWSPDGTLVAVAGRLGTTPGPTAIYIVRVADGTLVDTISPAGIEIGESVDWSPDGTHLVFDATGPRGVCDGAGVYLVRPDGTGLELLVAPSRQDPCGYLSPVWSPDGKVVAFTRAHSEYGSDGFTGDILTLDLASRMITPVTTGPGLDCCPAWQPIRR